jgi:hypothetical protein
MVADPSKREGWEESDEFEAAEMLFADLITKLREDGHDVDEGEIIALFVNIDAATPYPYNEALDNVKTYCDERHINFDDQFDPKPEDLDINTLMADLSPIGDEDREINGGPKVTSLDEIDPDEV